MSTDCYAYCNTTRPIDPTPTTTSTSTSSTTTTVGCKSKCKWKSNPGGTDWVSDTNPCPTECPCSPPAIRMPRDLCDTVDTPCSSGTSSTTTTARCNGTITWTCYNNTWYREGVCRGGGCREGRVCRSNVTMSGSCTDGATATGSCVCLDPATTTTSTTTSTTTTLACLGPLSGNVYYRCVDGAYTFWYSTCDGRCPSGHCGGVDVYTGSCSGPVAVSLPCGCVATTTTTTSSTTTTSVVCSEYRSLWFKDSSGANIRITSCPDTSNCAPSVPYCRDPVGPFTMFREDGSAWSGVGFADFTCSCYSTTTTF